MRRGLIASAAAYATVVPSASAGNAAHDPTPIVFTDEPCVAVVERPAAGVHTVAYTVAREDLLLSCDEPPDSRRHQVVAISMPQDPQVEMPRWLTWADVETAAAHGLVELDDVGMDDVLETSSAHADAWTWVTPADERRPITCEAAAPGVDWDVAAIDPGVYTLFGYTWEPPRNAWVRRNGVVKVVDAMGTDDGDLPAASLRVLEDPIYAGQTSTLRVCVDAVDGSTMTVSSRAGNGTDWTPFVEDEPIVEPSAEVTFDPGDFAGSFETFVFRVEVTDPLGRTYTGYGDGSLLASTAAPPDQPPDDEPCDPADPYCVDPDDALCNSTAGQGGTAVYDGCETTTGATGETSTGTSSTSGTGAGAEDGAGGCACRAYPVAPPAWTLVLLLALLPRRASRTWP